MRLGFSGLLIFLYLSGCATYGDIPYISPDFSDICSKAIAVLPVMNETIDLDAPKAFEALIGKKVKGRGYRVIEGEWITNRLSERDVHYAEQVRTLSYEELGSLLGADALLYTTVTKWRTLYLVAYASIGVGARFELVDSKTGSIIWQMEKDIEERKLAADQKAMRETALFAISKRYEPLVERLLDNTFKSLPNCSNR